MTVQIKYFIEAGDIVAVRLACERCGTSLTVSISEKLEKAVLKTCPQCREPWASQPSGTSIESVIIEFIKSLNSMEGAIRQWADINKEGGFRLMLEIKSDAAPPLPSQHGK